MQRRRLPPWDEIALVDLVSRYRALKRAGASLPPIWVDAFEITLGLRNNPENWDAHAREKAAGLPMTLTEFRHFVEALEQDQHMMRKPPATAQPKARRATA